MQTIKARFITNTSFFILMCMLALYVIVRAVCIDMTHDEAYSFYNVKHFWYVEALCTGNTHWFNFAAIKLMVMLGLEKAWQLRWFTMLSSVVFLSIGYHWIKSIKTLPLKLFAFSFLFLNPYLLDYFSLARGYAAGLTLEALSIGCLMIAHSKKNKQYALIALFFAGMSAIANFNFFYFFAAFAMVYFYNYYFKNGLPFLKDKRFYMDSIFTIGIIALVLRALLFITKCSNDIGAYGGDSFVESVFYGFVDGLLYRNVVLPHKTIYSISYAVFAIVFCASLFGVYSIKKKHLRLYTYASTVFLLMIALMVINKWCFGVLYPTYRTTLMFYPLIAIILVGFLTEILRQKVLQRIILYSFSALLLLIFLLGINLHSTFDYPEQRDAKKAFEFVQDLGAKKTGIAPELYGVFRNYYQQTDKYNYSFVGESINTSVPVGIDAQINKLGEYQYLILFPPYKLSFYKNNNNVRFEGVKYFNDTGTLLVKVK